MLPRNAKRKFLLGQTASDLISAHGDQFFAIISHPDATSPAESAGRMILAILPTDKTPPPAEAPKG